VFFNTTLFMISLGLMGYIGVAVPGCIGAGRKDRIPIYFWRSVTLVLLCSLPGVAVQLFSEPIMSYFGVPPSLAQDIGQFTRLLVMGGVLMLIEANVETCFVSLGYAKTATFNSLLTGGGIDVIASCLLIYKWDWGLVGCALVFILARLARLLVWLAAAA
jgi:Na+-driven multidrug efflux pump